MWSIPSVSFSFFMSSKRGLSGSTLEGEEEQAEGEGEKRGRGEEEKREKSRERMEGKGRGKARKWRERGPQIQYLLTASHNLLEQLNIPAIETVINKLHCVHA